MTFIGLCVGVILSVSGAKGKHLFSLCCEGSQQVYMNINIFPLISGSFKLDQTSAVYVLFM